MSPASECCSEIYVVLKKGLCNPVTQGPGSGWNSSAVNVGYHIKFSEVAGKQKGFIHHELQLL